IGRGLDDGGTEIVDAAGIAAQAGREARRVRVQADAEQGLVLALRRAQHVEEGHAADSTEGHHAPEQTRLAWRSMHTLTRQQLVVLVLLTLVWGINWPIMKLGVTDFPPLSFRTISMWLGLPVLAAVLLVRGVSFRIPRPYWRELLVLTVLNMLVWHTLAILAIRSLSSGRAAILGYTMPVFSAMIGALWFSQRLAPRAWAGVAAAALGVVLLLWHEATALTGRPLGVAMMLLAAAIWAVGTHRMRRTTIPASTLAISFWMTLITTLWMTLLSVMFERSDWHWPSPPVWSAIVYN